MSADGRNKTPVLLMVSGGSDSTALLELAHAYVSETEMLQEHFCLRHHEGWDRNAPGAFLSQGLPKPDECALFVLHVNHMLRGEASDADEAFVRALCERLGIPCFVERVDIAALSAARRGGMEAIAREARYALAEKILEQACQVEKATSGIICTAHTLDDRIETFFMRSLVGTGPGGLASIPRERGNVRRPLLDATREELRDWLRAQHPGQPDSELWREDETNTSGDNFRSRLRISLTPVLQELRPNFESSLAQTMDLMADEDEMLQNMVDSQLYRSLDWDGSRARIELDVIRKQPKPLARRMLREMLLIVHPDARLEAAQIDRVLAHLDEAPYVTEVSGGLRVAIDDSSLTITKVQ